jgi:hypothetical protein
MTQVKISPILNSQQTSLIKGGLLGDAHMEMASGFPRLYFTHSMKQCDYLIYKYEILKDYVKTEPKVALIHDKRTNKIYTRMHFKTLQNKEFKEIYDGLYINKKKIVTSKYLESIDEFGLAIWLCDDGCLKIPKKGMPRFILATCCFSIYEQELIKNWFLNMYDIKCNIISNGKSNKVLAFCTKDSVSKISAIIKKYNIPNMDYKIYE